MKFKSEIVTQASGSIGGTTYSHNAFGLYRRARTVPVNPQTAFQTQVRDAFINLVNRWTSVLTAAQRAAWNTYGVNVPTTDSLGDTINLKGQAWYLAANVPIVQAKAKLPIDSSGIAIVDDAPAIFNRGEFSDPAFTYSEASGLSSAFTNTDDWANEDGSAMLIYQGLPMNASRSFFKGPWRLVEVIAGNATTAPTSPETKSAASLITNGFEVIELQACWTKVRVIRADGRISSERIYGPDAVGA